MTGHVINGLRRVAGTFLKKKGTELSSDSFCPSSRGYRSLGHDLFCGPLQVHGRLLSNSRAGQTLTFLCSLDWLCSGRESKGGRRLGDKSLTRTFIVNADVSKENASLGTKALMNQCELGQSSRDDLRPPGFDIIFVPLTSGVALVVTGLPIWGLQRSDVSAWASHVSCRVGKSGDVPCRHFFSKEKWQISLLSGRLVSFYFLIGLSDIDTLVKVSTPATSDSANQKEASEDGKAKIFCILQFIWGSWIIHDAEPLTMQDYHPFRRVFFVPLSLSSLVYSRLTAAGRNGRWGGSAQLSALSCSRKMPFITADDHDILNELPFWCCVLSASSWM